MRLFDTVLGGPEHALLVTRGIYSVAFGRGEVAGSIFSTASVQVKMRLFRKIENLQTI